MIPSISIVIPTWNGKELLTRFLPSILAAAQNYSHRTHTSAEILVVDDASTDGTIHWLQSQALTLPPLLALRWILNEQNLGFAAACNRGFSAARAPLVFLLNNDVEVEPDSVAYLAEKFHDSSVFAVHCRVLDWETGNLCGAGKVASFSRGFIRVHRSYVTQSEIRKDATAPSTASAVERLYSAFAGGGASMFHREKFLALGGFETLLSPFYWEDVELSYRAWKRGYVVLYEPQAVARHQRSSTIRKLDQKKVKCIEQRNRLLFHWINLHERGWLASHCAWVFLLSLTFSPRFLKALYAALRQMPFIRTRRRLEKNSAVRTDRDLFALFETFARRPNILAFDNQEELEHQRGEITTAGARRGSSDF